MVDVEKFQRVLVAVEQLPPGLRATRDGAFDAEIIVVLIYQLVPLIADTVMPLGVVAHVVVHPVAVLGHLLPTAGCLPLQQRSERDALHVRWHLQAGQVAKSRREIDVADDVLEIHGPKSDHLWISDQERHLKLSSYIKRLSHQPFSPRKNPRSDL